jgi:Domain of unknown function (DUF4271)
MSRISSSTDTTLTMQSMAAPDPVYQKSVFTSHQLHPVNMKVNEIKPMEPDWVTGLLIFCFMILAWSQVFYYKRIRQIFMAPFSKRFLSQLTREGNLFKERISLALGTVYFLGFSLLLFEFNEQILKLTIPVFRGIALYGIITLAIVAVTAVKVSLIQLLGIVFKTRETTYNYLLNLLIFALLSGPLILAFLVFILYLKFPVLLHICLILFIVFYLFRFVRSFFIGITLTKFSYLFLFVYLCSLEILPLLVIIKLLLNQAQATGG